MFKSWDELTEEEQLHTTLSDVHKDVYGVRPHSRYNGMSVEQLKEELEFLYKELEVEIDREKEAEKAAIKKFEKMVGEIMEMCSCVRDKAIKYLVDAEGADWYDYDHMCWEYHLPFGYFKDMEK